MAKDKDSAAKPVQVDFTNVKDGGNFNKKRQPAGDYKADIIKVTDVAKKGEKKKSMWLFTITVKSGTYPYYCNYLEENQLWKIRNLFIAAGINVPKKRLQVDPNKVVGRSIGVTLEDDEYDGKAQSNIASTFPTSELDGDEPDEDEQDEKPKKKKGKKSKEAAPEPVEAPQGGKKGKKGKAKKVDDVSDSELEELDIDEI